MLPAWQRWLSPERPGLVPFASGVVLLLLPLACIFHGAAVFVPALVLSVALGLGFAIGWSLVHGRRWWRSSRLTTLAVLGVHVACALNLDLVPRLDGLLRAHALSVELGTWWVRRTGQEPPPGYATGTGTAVLALIPDALPAADAPVAYTPEPLRRWSLTGWKPATWIVLLREGTCRTLRSEAELARVLAGAASARDPAGRP